MIKITTVSGEAFDLPKDFSIQIEDSSPIFNDRGSQSVPVTLPPTDRNRRLTGYICRMDSYLHTEQTIIDCTVYDGTYVRSGKMNVDSASSQEGISVNIGFDNSIAYLKWSQKKLCEIYFPSRSFQSIQEVADAFNSGTLDNDFASFPIVVSEDSATNPETDEEQIYLDCLTGDIKTNAYKVMRVTGTDKTVREIDVPPLYGTGIFIRVGCILEYVFRHIGCTIVDNPFITDPDLKSLVVLNSVEDALCKLRIDYTDLLPDVTVEQFLKALWARFGMVYTIDYDRMLANIMLLKDILEKKPDMTDEKYGLTNRITGFPKITYNAPQYLRLSAGTSLTYAPAGFDTYRGLSQYAKEHISITTKCFSSGDGLSLPADGLIFNPLTGNWYYKGKFHGSSYFPYDPGNSNMEPLEISSDDECVPIYPGTSESGLASTLPAFLIGPKHVNTVSTYDHRGELDEELKTPLGFMFDFGNILPFQRRWTVAGTQKWESGSVEYRSDGFRLSMLFDFEHGLFANFWRKFDEILRHGNRTIEVSLSLRKEEVRSLDILRPVFLMGMPCLIDTMTYSLPANKIVTVRMKLRSITPSGEYDRDNEQFGDSLPLDWLR